MRSVRSMVVFCLVSALGLSGGSPSAMPAETPAPPASPAPPKGKETKPGLYLTAREAYEKWKADPASVKIIDVRTTEEYLFVGHAPMAWNVPLFVQSYEWDPARRQFAMKPNPGFIAQVKEVAKPSDVLLLMCRSGSRSAAAVNRLADEGFTRIYNVIDGMEGDLVEDPSSVFHGQRVKNGWKNSGVPWTYDVDPEKVRLPKQP